MNGLSSAARHLGYFPLAFIEKARYTCSQSIARASWCGNVIGDIESFANYVAIAEKLADVVRRDPNIVRLKVAERVYLGEEALYIWAILRSVTEAEQ